MSKLDVTNLGSLVNPSFKNKIINSDFNIWQRGTSFTGLTASTFTADRMELVISTDGSLDITRSTTIPTQVESNHYSNYSFKIDVDTTDATIAADQYALIRYIIEGYDVASLMSKEVTLSFWVRSSKTGTYCVSFISTGGDQTYITEYVINSANTWEKKEITLTMADGSSGTWDFINGRGLMIYFGLAVGSNYHAAKDTWLATYDFATSSQVNFMDNVANNIYFSQVQFEIGSFSTPFENRPIGIEMAMCQRYYEKSYLYSDVPGTWTNNGVLFWNEALSNNNFHKSMETFKVRKRTTPTLTAYSPATGDSARVRNYSTGADAVQSSIDLTSDKAFGRFNATANAGDQHQLGLHWTADAEF